MPYRDISGWNRKHFVSRVDGTLSHDATVGSVRRQPGTTAGRWMRCETVMQTTDLRNRDRATVVGLFHLAGQASWLSPRFVSSTLDLDPPETTQRTAAPGVTHVRRRTFLCPSCRYRSSESVKRPLARRASPSCTSRDTRSGRLEFERLGIARECGARRLAVSARGKTSICPPHGANPAPDASGTTIPGRFRAASTGAPRLGRRPKQQGHQQPLLGGCRGWLSDEPGLSGTNRRRSGKLGNAERCW